MSFEKIYLEASTPWLNMGSRVMIGVEYADALAFKLQGYSVHAAKIFAHRSVKNPTR